MRGPASALFLVAMMMAGCAGAPTTSTPGADDRVVPPGLVPLDVPDTPVRLVRIRVEYVDADSGTWMMRGEVATPDLRVECLPNVLSYGAAGLWVQGNATRHVLALFMAPEFPLGEPDYNGFPYSEWVDDNVGYLDIGESGPNGAYIQPPSRSDLPFRVGRDPVPMHGSLERSFNVTLREDDSTPHVVQARYTIYDDGEVPLHHFAKPADCP